MAGVSSWQQTPPLDFVVMCPEDLDLSGGDVTHLFYPVPAVPTWGNDNNNSSLVIKEWIIMFTEATAAAASGGILKLGRPGNDVRYHTYDTLNSQSVGDVIVLANTVFANDRVLITDNSIQIRNVGNLAAAGACRIGVRLSRRYDQWKNFDGFGL